MEGIVRWGADVRRRLFGNRGKVTQVWARLCLWGVCVFALAMTGAASATRYVYDANGRLVAVTNDAGESARYVYDVMGNILQVDRLAAGELALFSFSPERGVSGTQVRLQGQGFSPIPASNAVRFGGAAATVTTASSTDLLVIVPPGATTGPISIAVGSQSVSSTKAFIVDESDLAPSIDGFSPAVGVAGDSITITGRSLYPLNHQTAVRVGGRTSAISSSGDTSLTFTVPSGANTGKVSVSTPYGMAVSTQDLVVLPSGISPGEITSSTRVLPDAPAGNFSTQATGERAAVMVDAQLGEYLDVQFSSISVASLAYSVYDPSNRLVVSGTATPANPSLLLPPADSAGTYLLLIKPVQGPASWNLSIERSKSITEDGDFSSLATTVNGQKKRLIFYASRDQRLGLGVVEPSFSSGTYMSIAVLSRDGTSVTSGSCYASYAGCHFNIRAPQASTYSIVFTPQSGQTFQTKAILSNDLYIALQREVPLDLTLARRGQNGRLTFSAQAGDSIALSIFAQTTFPAGRAVNYSIYKPDGTLLSAGDVFTYQIFNFPSLPQSGDYFVFVDADYGATMGSRVVLMDSANNNQPIDGNFGQFAAPLGGQSAYFNFDVTEADQRLGLGISDLVLSSGTYVNAYVYRPDGTTLVSTTCTQSDGGCDLNVRAPVVGRYSVMVKPASASQTMQFKITLSNDLRTDIARESPLQLQISRRGQNARLFFDAQAGETLALQVAGTSTFPAGKSVTYQVVKPDGTVFKEASTSSFSTVLLSSLPSDGKYMVFVDPSDGETLDVSLTLTDGRQSGMVIDGASGEYVAQIPGHPAFLTFDASEVDQRLGLAVHDIQLSTGTYVNVYLYRPDGTSLTSGTCYQASGCEFNIRAAAVGRYSVVVSPQASSSAISLKATLSNDMRGVLARETPTSLVIPRYGQNMRASFVAAAGENLALQITGQATESSGRSVTYSIYKPDGTLLTSAAPSAYADLRMINLPASGEYLLFIDPTYGVKAQARLLLTAGNGDAPVVNGDQGGVTTTVAGQATFTTFPVTEVGQQLGIGISDLTASSGSYVSMYVYRPNGSTVGSVNCNLSNQGCDANFSAPEVGNYSIVVAPQNATQTMSYKVTVSNDLRVVLPRETTFALGIPRRGQNARLAFSAQAGETMALKLSGQATVPAGKSVSYQIYKPDGTSLTSGGGTSNDVINMTTLPASGEYQVFVDPAYGATVNAQLVLTSGTDSGATVDGAVGDLSTVLPGQSAYVTFQASAGQQIGLGISDLAVSSGSYVSVYTYRPGGVTAGSGTCSVSNGGCAFNINAVETGIYSVVVTPQSASQTMSFKATISQDLVATLERDAPFDLVLPRRGQNQRLNFNGQAGEALSLQVAGQTSVPSGRSVYYRVYKPDGSALNSFSTTNLGAMDMRLPVTGTYQVLVEGGSGESVVARVTLSTGDTQQVGGSPGSLQTAFGGQPVYATFQAAAGQQLGIGIYDLVLSTGTSLGAAVYRPNGTSATTATCSTSNQGCKLSLTATDAGIYSVVVTPQTANQTMSFKLAISPDLTGTLQKDTPVDINIARRGQNARFTYAGQAGEWLSLQVAGQMTVPAGKVVYYRIYRPEGTLLISGNITGMGTVNPTALPATGAYTVLVDSGYGETVSSRVTIASGASALQLDGASTSVATSFGGQPVFLAFNATAGQRLGVGLTEVQASAGTYFGAAVYRPDGSSTSGNCYPQNYGCEFNTTANVTGTYRIVVTPALSTQLIGFRATVSTDLEKTLQRGERTVIELSREGQNGWIAFNGVAGEAPSILIADPSTWPSGGSTNYTVYRPDGGTVASTTSVVAKTWQLPSLPSTGEYRIFVSPAAALPLTVALTVQ